MPISLDFSTAEEQREQLTGEQQEEIKELYKQLAEEIGKQAEAAPRVPSDALRAQYLRELQGQIKKNLRELQGELNTTIKSNMKEVATIITQDAKGFLDAYGLPIQGAYSHVPADIVQSVISGQLYAGDWTLSRALWLNTMETQKDVERVIAIGIAENKSTYEIAKDLERYVDPSARKDWEWSKVYPNTRKVVDYNAQRLARTMVSHAYQQAFVRVTQKNPFVTKYQWLASNSDRTCEICEERDGQLFDKDDLPLDHPNGMCTFLAVIEDSPEQIADRLADWVEGKEDPALDAWAKDLYGRDSATAQTALFNTERDFKTVTGDEKYVQSYSDQLLANMGGISGIPKSQLEALSNYTGDSYRAFNSIASGGSYRAGATRLTKSQVKQQVGQLSNLIRSQKLPEDLMLYRGSPVSQFASNRSALPSLVGKEISLGRFGSTSLNREIAEGFVEANSKSRGLDMILVQVKAPQGCNACLATSMEKQYSGYGWLTESEVLFAPDQRYRVESFDNNILTLEVLSNG